MRLTEIENWASPKVTTVFGEDCLYHKMVTLWNERGFARNPAVSPRDSICRDINEGNWRLSVEDLEDDFK
jgi:hypothetical protein